MKKNKNQNITRIACLLIILSGLITLFVFETGGKLLSLVATLTTVIGIFSVYIQMRKSKHVGQSAFTLEISKYLYEMPEIPEFIHRLGRASDVDNVEYIVKESERRLLIKYLNYLKTIAALVDEKTVSIETLNKVFAYEFFIIVNNKSVQTMELQPFSCHYEDLFRLYDSWTRYLKSHHLDILHQENALSNIPEYKKYIGGFSK